MVRRFVELESTISEEHTWLANLPTPFWDRLALLSNLAPSTLRSNALRVANVAAVYSHNKPFKATTAYPWSLSIGSVEENLDSLLKEPDVSDPVASKEQQLMRLGFNKHFLVSSVCPGNRQSYPATRNAPILAFSARRRMGSSRGRSKVGSSCEPLLDEPSPGRHNDDPHPISTNEQPIPNLWAQTSLRPLGKSNSGTDVARRQPMQVYAVAAAAARRPETRAASPCCSRRCRLYPAISSKRTIYKSFLSVPLVVGLRTIWWSLKRRSRPSCRAGPCSSPHGASRGRAGGARGTPQERCAPASLGANRRSAACGRRLGLASRAARSAPTPAATTPHR